MENNNKCYTINIFMKYNIADILYKIVNQSLDEIITEEMIINA